MSAPEGPLLLQCPYRPPRVRRGDRLFCEIRGTVVVRGYTDAPIPWARVKKGGNPCLVTSPRLASRISSGWCSHWKPSRFQIESPAVDDAENSGGAGSSRHG